MPMFDPDFYYGSIIKGDLPGAIAYVKQFPEKSDVYEQFLSVFEHRQFLSYEVNAQLNDILLAYQQYYCDVFYLRLPEEQAAKTLQKKIQKYLGLADESIAFCDLEQNQLPHLFKRHNLHFLGGKTGGYYGPYIWKTTDLHFYDVELPHGIQRYCVKMLDGFLSRSWIDYLSFGEIGTGGWTDGDGSINCIQSAWDQNSEHFRVSLLKHEAQHAHDLEKNPNLSSEQLEYRAKLVELIYSTERNLLLSFAQEADASDPCNGHAMAAHRIITDFSDFLGHPLHPEQLSPIQIQSIAKELFQRSATH